MLSISAIPVCGPEVDGCTLCNAPRTIEFTLNTENWCSEVVVSCNNGQLDDGEDCEGSNLNGKSCLSEGFLGGTLACAADCSFDTSGCHAARAFATRLPDQHEVQWQPRRLGRGGDAKCQERANVGQLGGTWRAWLSTTMGDVMARIPNAEFRLIDRTTVIATDKADLLDLAGPASNINGRPGVSPIAQAGRGERGALRFAMAPSGISSRARPGSAPVVCRGRGRAPRARTRTTSSSPAAPTMSWQHRGNSKS